MKREMKNYELRVDFIERDIFEDFYKVNVYLADKFITCYCFTQAKNSNHAKKLARVFLENREMLINK